MNLSYVIYDENIFSLNRPTALSLWVANLTDSKSQAYINDMYEKLFSVCATMNEFPFVAY